MLALTESLGQEILDSRGARVGSLADMAARIDTAYPTVTALRDRELMGAFATGRLFGLAALLTIVVLTICVGALAALTLL